MSDNTPFAAHDAPEAPPSIGVEAQVAAVAGRTVALRVAVRNDASGPRVLQVALLGLDPSWLPRAEHTESIAPGEVADLTFVLSPERGAVAADYPFAVTAAALDPITGEAAASRPGLAEAVLTVSPRAQVQVKVVPGEFSAVVRKRFTVEVRNEGDVTSLVHLSSTQPHHARIGLSRDSVDVGPRSTVLVRGAVRIRRPRFFGWIGSHRFTVSALGADAQAHAEGVVLQRPLTPPFAAKAIALVTAVSLWLAAAMIFLPQFGQWVRSSTAEANKKVTEKIVQRGEDGGSSTPGSGGSGSSGSSGGQGGAGDAGAGSGGGAGGGTDDGSVVRAGQRTALQLTGSVAQDAPGGVTVRLAPTSLVDEAAQGGIGIGVPDDAVEASGLRLASATSKVSARRAQPAREVSTSADGSYTFAGVQSPGYYLLSFTKPGFQTRTYVIDSSSEAAKQPLEVPLSTGQGGLSGRITGPQGPIGGAEVTISDGTNTITTSSNSKGNVGAWSVQGLSTPGSFVVHASSHGMSSEARLVRLEAGASASADLRLTAGVATLTGTLTREGDDGQEVGLGGARITISDGAGTTRTATTVTQGRTGFYTLPSLKAPGRYSLTMSADGFQQRTTTLVLTRGQSHATRSAMLSSSAGILSGQMKGPEGGIVGAGLVLANAENTYKTTSTSSPEAGAYKFNGVTPGTYSLTTTMFGLVTDRVTVTLTSGGSKILGRTLVAQQGGAVPNTSILLGSVTDAANSLALRTCSPQHPRFEAGCVRASVDDTEATGSSSSPKTVTYTDDFDPSETYRLPAEGSTGGLRPGLHTVTVAAPGYMIGKVDVQVGLGQTVIAPNLALTRVPKITGRISTPPGAPISAACVWVVPGNSFDTPSRQDCEAAKDAGANPATALNSPDACFPDSYVWQALDTKLTRACALTDSGGSYSIEVPSEGTYTIFATPLDAEYDGGRETRTTSPANDTIWNWMLAQRPVVDLTVLRPNHANALEGVNDVRVSVDPEPSVPFGSTQPDGRVELRGLNSGPVTITATDPTDGRQSGTLSLTLVPNTRSSATLVLDKPSQSLIGRVNSRVFGQEQLIEGAQARVEVATRYPTGTPSATPLPETVNVVTSIESGSKGCFEVRRTTEAPRTTATCGTITGSAAGTTPTLASSRALSLRVTAAGYQDLTETNVLFDANVQSVQMTPKAVAVQANVRAVPVAPAWNTATVTVTGLEELAPRTVPATIVGGALQWADPTEQSGRARPGLYRVSVKAPGYADAEGVLRCAIAGTCFWVGPDRVTPTDELTLKQLGSVKITTVTGANVALVHGTADPSLADGTTLLNGEVDAQFSTVVPNADTATSNPSSDLRVRVRAPGYAYGTSQVSPGPQDVVRLSCTVGSTGTVTNVVLVVPGQLTACAVQLVRLGTITGTVSAFTHPDPTGSGGVSQVLDAVTVRASRCTDSSCTAVEPDEQFSVDSDPDGAFSITGTNVNAGLQAGWWALLPSKQGYEWDGPPLGTPVQVGATSVTENLRLTQQTQIVDVTVQNAAGDRITNATVSRTSLSAPTPITGTPLTNAAGVHQFLGVEPGYWSFRVVAEGMQEQSVIQFVAAGSGPVSVTVVMSPRSGSVTGQVANESQVPVGGATVELTCPAGVTGCQESGGVALSASGTRLSTRSDATGGYTLAGVPNGTYGVRAARAGHQQVSPAADAEITVTAPLATRQDFTLSTVTSSITWTLTSGAGAPVQSSQITLVPTSDPGLPVVLTSGALKTGVASGCYDVSVALPEKVQGSIGAFGAASGNLPVDSQLGCRADQLTVPAQGADAGADIDVTQPVESRKVTVSLAFDPDVASKPVVALTAKAPGLSTLSWPTAGATTEMWLSPVAYTVEATTPGSVFWYSTNAQATVGTADLTLTLRQKTAEVTVNLPRAGWTLTVEPGFGQEALPPLYTGTTTGTITNPPLKLPRGRWVLEATWPSADGTLTHVDQLQINITDETARSLTFSDPAPGGTP